MPAIALAVVLSALVPFLVAFTYAHPTYDDQGYYFEAARRGVIGAELHWYLSWSGRYVSDTIMSAASLLSINRVPLYRVLCLLIFFALALSIYGLFRATLRVQRLHAVVLTSMALLAWLTVASNVGESLYWLTGAVTYTLAAAVAIRAITRAAEPTQGAELRWGTAGWCALAVGMNEFNLVLVNAFLGLLVLRDLIDTRSVSRAHLLWLCAALVATAVALLAPGNWNRLHVTEATWVDRPSSVQVLVWAGTAFAQYSYYMALIGPLFFLLLAAVVLVGSGAARRLETDGRRDAAAFLVMAAALFAYLIVYIRAQNQMPITRIANVFYLALMLMCVVAVGRWAARSPRTLSARGPVVMLLVVAGLISDVVREGSGVRRAYAEWRTGVWDHVERGLAQRRSIVARASGGAVRVPPVRSELATTWVFDISADSTDRYNRYYAFYYGVSSIVLDSTRHAGTR